MAPSMQPRGHLPARVYWFRRGLVLATALALVFAFAQLVGGGDPKPVSKAQVSAAKPTTTPKPQVQGPAGPPVNGTAAALPTGTPPPAALAQPNGPCTISELTVTPVAGKALAGRAIPLTLQLTGIRPACTFEVSPSSLVAKVTSGKQRVWSTQDCPAAIRTSTVVVRSGAPTTVVISWNGRRSDGQCGGRTNAWAMPGTYRVIAAAIGSEPSAAAVMLTAPPRPVVIKTVQPKPKKKAGSAGTTAAGR